MTDYLRLFFNEVALENSLREYLDNRLDEAPPYLDSVIRQYGPIALVMDTFYQKLQKESKSTPYPRADLDNLLATIAPVKGQILKSQDL